MSKNKILLCLFILWGCIHSPVYASGHDEEELLVEVYLNQSSVKQIAHILRDSSQHIYVAEEDLILWHIQLPSRKAISFNQQNYYQLDWFPGLYYSLDMQKLDLSISVPASLFLENVINVNQSKPNVLRPLHSGGYLNYDFSLQHLPFSPNNRLSGITELVYFNPQGVGSTQFLWQRSNHDIVRLNTTWTLDQPESMHVWKFGDAVTSFNIYSGGVRFGGIQYATNFNTQPELITFPLPSFRGKAIVPTTVDFFLNEQLQHRQEVASGAFEIDELPVITGAGNLIVRTQDILGRESVVVLPFYATRKLLRPGLAAFSYEAGLIRNNYGLQSNDYDRLMAVGNYRRGINGQWTAGWRGELLAQQQTLGVTSDYLLFNYGVLTLAGAVSHHRQEKGGLLLGGFSRRASAYSYGVQTQLASHDYVQLDLPDHHLSPRAITQIYASYAPHALGTFSVNYLSRHARSEPDSAIMTFAYTRNLAKNFFFIFNAIKSMRHPTEKQFFASLIWSPAQNYTLSANAIQENGHAHAVGEFSKALPVGNGYGYGLQVANNESGPKRAYFAAKSDVLFYSAEVSRREQINLYQLQAAGSIAFFAKEIFFSRPIEDSFAVVQVPEIAHVRIYDSNQLIGRTNSQGNLLIPHTLPYEKNDIRIELQDLPLDAQIDSEQLFAYPYFHSGTLVKFPVKQGKNIRLILVDEHSHPIPAGAEIQVQQEIFLVGTGGEAYLFTVLKKNQLNAQVQWGKQLCQIQEKVPHTTEAFLDLGTIICKEIHHA